MCDAVKIKRRLRQFGGCTVVMLKDLLQMPPHQFGNVQYAELETVVRQETDPEFGKMLKRWCSGYCSHDDKVLNEMVTLFVFKDEELFNVSREVHVRQNSTVRRHLMFSVGINSRVMIFKNHPSDVNGEIGLVEGLLCDSENHVKKLVMRMCGTNEVWRSALFLLVVLMIQVRLDSRFNIRQMLNSKSYWCYLQEDHSDSGCQPAHAVTYHKAQGQTLKKVFLELLYICIYNCGVIRLAPTRGGFGSTSTVKTYCGSMI
ncbi:unnamed protein product [Caenorhabditis brenneri]